MKELTLQATVEHIPDVTDFVDGELEALDCPVKARIQIDVAIDELFGNIAHYAYAPDTGEATVRFGWDPAARMVTITFIDRGVPYDPLKKEDPDVSLSAEERALGGLGIFLVKKTMDDIIYHRVDDQNVLSIMKKI